MRDKYKYREPENTNRSTTFYTSYKYDDGICKRKSVGNMSENKKGEQPLKFRDFLL